MNWVDYGIIVILILGVYGGLKKGLLASVYSIICLLVSILAAKTYYIKFSVYLVKNTPLQEKITGFLSEKNLVNNVIPGPFGEIPAFNISNSFASDFNAFLSVLIINAISGLIIFVGVRIVLGIAEGLLSEVVSIPGLREVNRLGGAAVGLIKNLIIIMLIFTVITPALPIRHFSQWAEGIAGSTLAKYFYDYNFILGWVWSAALDILNK